MSDKKKFNTIYYLYLLYLIYKVNEIAIPMSQVRDTAQVFNLLNIKGNFIINIIYIYLEFAHNIGQFLINMWNITPLPSVLLLLVFYISGIFNKDKKNIIPLLLLLLDCIILISSAYLASRSLNIDWAFRLLNICGYVVIGINVIMGLSLVWLGINQWVNISEEI